MSVYESGASAMRDTVKWLVAFVPTATLIAGGAALGPDVVDSAASTTSPSEFVSDQGLTVVGLALVLAGLVAIVLSGARVLAAAPTDFTDLLEDEQRLTAAIGAGVGSPFFTDERSFRNGLADLRSSFAAAPAETPYAKAVTATADDLRTWAWFDQARGPFQLFKWWFVAGVALVLAGYIVVAVDQPAPERTAASIGLPTPVSVEIQDPSGLEEATQCSDVAKSTFVAIGGTWTQPLLDIDGPGCTPGATWAPSSGAVELNVP